MTLQRLAAALGSAVLLSACHGPPGLDMGSPDAIHIDFGPGPDLSTPHDGAVGRPDLGPASIKTVFLILLENTNWSEIKGTPSAHYINTTLLPMASYAENYGNLAGIHPSLPNYLWLEAGTNFTILHDVLPSVGHQGTRDHLVTQLKNAGITWRAYAEDIDGTNCPLQNTKGFVPRHVGMLYFDDVTDTNSSTSPYCIAHVRPLPELDGDLMHNTVARYNFIVPNLCHDGHDIIGCDTLDHVKNLDTWLSGAIPQITGSAAYADGGAIFIAWDESENGDHAIGMIVVSPQGKGHGYSNMIAYNHSSTLRTLQTIFGVTPFLGGAAGATDLSDLFTTFP